MWFGGWIPDTFYGTALLIIQMAFPVAGTCGDGSVSMASAPERHHSQIDGLRAIAVMAVLVTHFWLPQSHAGHWGVRLFFVISGFLITGILLNNRFRQDAGERGAIMLAFYKRRALRIFPAFYFALFIVLIARIEGVARTLPFHALYASNILAAYRDDWAPWVTAHLWSLSVEEQFYLVWPAFMLFLPRRILPVFLIAVTILSIVFKEICFQIDPDGVDQYVLMPAAIDAMAVGAILANLTPLFGASEEAIRRVSRVLLALSFVIVPLIAFGQLAHLPWSVVDFLAVIPMGYLVLASSLGMTGVAGRMLNNPVLRYLGKISYGIYLWHLFACALLFKFVPPFLAMAADPGPIQFFGAGSVTIVIAALSWHFLESPLNALKRHIPYRRRAVQAAATVS